MAKLKRQEIQGKTAAELESLVAEQRQKLGQLVVESRTKKLTNVKEFSHYKKNIARGLTRLRQLQLEKEEQNG